VIQPEAHESGLEPVDDLLVSGTVIHSCAWMEIVTTLAFPANRFQCFYGSQDGWTGVPWLNQ